MKKASQFAAVLALASACAMPVLAQTSSSSSSTQPSTTQTPAASTQAMGAPGDDRPATRDNDRDMGWIGLLGLAGLLGLRRKHDRDDHVDRRPGTVR
jgi:hypothetical protein